MQNANERTEILAKIAAAHAALTAAAAELAVLQNSSDDVEDISNDAYNELAHMLHKLSTNYCVTTLAEDALEYYADE